MHVVNGISQEGSWGYPCKRAAVKSRRRVGVNGRRRVEPSLSLRPAASPSSVDQPFASSLDKNEEITIQSKLLRKEQVLDFANADLNVFTRGFKEGVRQLRCTEIFRVKTMTFFEWHDHS